MHTKFKEQNCVGVFGVDGIGADLEDFIHIRMMAMLRGRE